MWSIIKDGCAQSESPWKGNVSLGLCLDFQGLWVHGANPGLPAEIPSNSETEPPPPALFGLFLVFSMAKGWLSLVFSPAVQGTTYRTWDPGYKWWLVGLYWGVCGVFCRSGLREPTVAFGGALGMD